MTTTSSGSEISFDSATDTMHFFEGFFGQRDANDLLATLWTWQHADISANEVSKRDLGAALTATTARAIVIPSRKDIMFPVGESEIEVRDMPNAELRPIESNWGHIAGFGANPPDNALVDEALAELLPG